MTVNEDLRALQASCLNRGFYQGRAFQAKSTAPPVEDLPAEMERSAAEALQESTEILQRLRKTIQEQQDTIRSMEEEML